MEHFLENVADSVSQLVLFSVDTTEENINSVEGGAKIVEQSAKALNDIGEFFSSYAGYRNSFKRNECADNILMFYLHYS